MKLVAVFAQFCLLLGLVLAQERESPTCGSSNNGGLVGFTALTPHQLRAEIHEAVQETLSVALENFTEVGKEDRVLHLAAIGILQQTMEEVNVSLVQNMEETVRKLQDSLEVYIDRRLVEAVQNLTLAFRESLLTLDTSLSTGPLATPSNPPPSSPPPPHPGFSPSNPAESCLKVLDDLPTAPSGQYWLSDSSVNGAVSVYCDMMRTCGNLTGGWMRVANVDMTQPTQHCPGVFVEMTRPEPPQRLCVAGATGRGCFSHTFPTVGPSYSSVCGRILAYQDRTPNAFFPFHINTSLTIDDVYVDGISLMHGNPRFHIWTFAAALDETTGHLSGCGCSNIFMHAHASVPPYVAGNYFCDSGSRGNVDVTTLYSADPLWDGKGCGASSTCCSYNNPPWFFRELPSLTADGLEMRVCRDAGAVNENVPFEVVELYVR